MKKTTRLKFLLFIISIFSVNQANAQMKLIKKILSSEKDTTRSSSFLPLPVLSYAQETGLEFGVLALYSFYTDKKDLLTRSSSISGLATFTTKSQSNFYIQTDIWTPQNKYHYIGEVRLKNFPYNFYGVGDKTVKADEDKLGQKLFRLRGELEKQLARKYFLGITANFENYTISDKEAGGIFETPSVLGKNGGKVLYLGISQAFDNRNTNTYTTKGTLLKVTYSYAPNFFGKDNFSGSLIKGDFRTFISLNSRLVLGANAIVQSLQGKNTPFYLLPQLGNDQFMRGYYTGRYRDKNLLQTQAELRYRFSPKLGIVGFIGAGNVYSNQDISLNLKPNYGGGVRYFFDVDRGLSVRLDYGYGEKRPNEDRQQGFYLSLGEAF